MKKKHIGNVAVDSGQLLITDPCYIDSEWKLEPFIDVKNYVDTDRGRYSYRGCCLSTTTDKNGGPLHFELGLEGAGVAFASGYGDGFYPVYAFYNEDNRIVRIQIEMDI